MTRRRRRPPAPPPAGQTTDDATLTHHGLAAAPSDAKSVLIIACGALAREIIALQKRHAWDHIALTCLPAILHNAPDQIPGAVEAAVTAHRPHYDRIFVAYADCGTGGRLAETCARLGVDMLDGPHCYSFFDGNATFAERGEDEMRTFYLTDFLARQFDAFVWEPLGLDRHPDLRDMYFGHYDSLVYLAQTEDPALDAAAQSAAERLGLTYRRRRTGYGDLATELDALAQN